MKKSLSEVDSLLVVNVQGALPIDLTVRTVQGRARVGRAKWSFLSTCNMYMYNLIWTAASPP